MSLLNIKNEQPPPLEFIKGGGITAVEYTLYKKNLGKYISMDETCLSQGELYTIVTNKTVKGGKGR